MSLSWNDTAESTQDMDVTVLDCLQGYVCACESCPSLVDMPLQDRSGSFSRDMCLLVPLVSVKVYTLKLHSIYRPPQKGTQMY